MADLGSAFGVGRLLSGLEHMESFMTKKRLEARSALRPIAQALIQDHLAPDRTVTDVERFLTALTQALHDAYALGWKDCREVKGRSQ